MDKQHAITATALVIANDQAHLSEAKEIHLDSLRLPRISRGPVRRWQKRGNKLAALAYREFILGLSPEDRPHNPGSFCPFWLEVAPVLAL